MLYSLDDYFQIASNHALCNTSYPLHKDLWNNFRNPNIDLFQNEKDISIYFHIPFCKRLCSFCEYVKFPIVNESYLTDYLSILNNDVENFLTQYPDINIYGLDIGGGTPTALNKQAFLELMHLYEKVISKYHPVKDFEPSIEATFDTLDSYKLKLIHEIGINRISLGLQTSNSDILKSNNRYNDSLAVMRSKMEAIHYAGIDKVNIDLMYGLPGQKPKDYEETISQIALLNPEQVTLYEMRYNLLSRKANLNRHEMYLAYCYFYKRLTEMGYIARFGQNTFTKDATDFGLSSYLRSRMIDNISYKGFGIAAQSKSSLGISYNVGKTRMSFQDCIKEGTFYSLDNYVLPAEELLSKYIAVSGYFGQFSLDIMTQILGKDVWIVFKDEFDYLLNNKYISIQDNILTITKTGFEYYNAVCAMFYSNHTKEWLLDHAE